MKIVERIRYEKGDYVMVTRGFNKGMVGTVMGHDMEDGEVSVQLVNSRKLRNTGWDEDEEDRSQFFDEQTLKYINKTEYEQAIKLNKILIVPGLPVAIQAKGKTILIGDNVLTAAHAKKVAAFINKHTTSSKKVKKRA